MAYFIYDNLADATLASETRWNTVLGRAKRPEDVTRYAWPALVGLDGRAAVNASQFPTAVPSTAGFLNPVATLDPVNWPSPSRQSS